MERNQFTFYNSFHKSIQNLRSNKEKLQAYQMLCNYALYGALPDQDTIKPSVATIFAIAQPILDTAAKKAKAGLKSAAVAATRTQNLPWQE